MSKPGPKKKPDYLKVLSGTDQPCRMSGDQAREVKAPPVSEAKCPTYLKGMARKKWNELAPELVEQGKLNKFNIDEFAMYCQLVAEGIQAIKDKRQVTASMIKERRQLWEAIFGASGGGDDGPRGNKFSGNGRRRPQG